MRSTRLPEIHCASLPLRVRAAKPALAFVLIIGLAITPSQAQSIFRSGRDARAAGMESSAAAFSYQTPEGRESQLSSPVNTADNRTIISERILLAANDSDGATAEKSDAANRPVKDKWAVVIGVSTFSNPNIPQLKYPSKDAKDFAQFLIDKGNFAKDHVLLLTDKKASKVNILDAFGDGWLPRRAMEDDLVVIFISSHGSAADSAGENFIIAHDSDPNHPYATGIRLQDLSSEITKRTGCDRVVLLLDACHSGAAAVGAKGLQRTMTNFDVEKIAGVGQLIISSSKSDEVSWESKRYPNSVFTKSLIEALQAKGSQTSVAEAYNHLKDSVQQEVRFDRVASQTPVMLSRWKGQELSITGPAAEPRKVLAELDDSMLDSGTPAIASAPVNTVPSINSNPTNPVRSSNQPTNHSSGNSTGQQKSPVANIPNTYNSSANRTGTTIAKSNQPNQVAMMQTDWLNNGGDSTLETGTRLLSADELRSFSDQDLLCLYNEAFARHGRGFSMSLLQNHFNSTAWYRQDPDYHWRSNDPKVVARGGRLDDALVINERRTPKQWANMQLIKKVMDSRKL